MIDTSPRVIIIIVPTTPEEATATRGIPVISEIEPQPDPVYGHFFRWPEEVEQFLSQARPIE